MKSTLWGMFLLLVVGAVGACGGGDSTSQPDGDATEGDALPDGDVTDVADRADEVSTDTPPVDADGDTYPEGEDCDDGDADVFPGAIESCNGTDDNCDGTTDEDTAVDAETWYGDTDADEFGDPDATRTACEMPAGYVADGTDCDDGDAAINPGADELCNGSDDDCDGETDENGAVGSTAYYPDDDSDGSGDDAGEVMSCSMPDGYAPFGGDCDDTSDAVNPGSPEMCNGIDDNCDGATDEDTAVDAPTFYQDSDGDGFGDPAGTVVACSAPAGYVADGRDCDDASGDVHPGVVDLPDLLAIDANCDGIDGDLLLAVFVSTATGDDAATGLGTMGTGGILEVDAVATLARGIEIADACDPKCYVLIQEGAYDQGTTSLALHQGVSLYGGYTAEWGRRVEAVVTITAGVSPTVLADALTLDTMVQRLTIQGPDITATGGESVALLVQNTLTLERLHLTEVSVVAGHGGPGANGTNGTTMSCSCPGGAGGVAVGDPCTDRAAGGAAGGCNPVGYSLGGYGGYNYCMVCFGTAYAVTDGGNGYGYPGDSGWPVGAGGDTVGSFSGSDWVPSIGYNGNNGSHGTGGGGGGAGGSWNYNCWITACIYYFLGGNGGAGGNGGCAGSAGTGGGQGGGAFGIVLRQSVVTLETVTVVLGTGGAGGRGGTGGNSTDGTAGQAGVPGSTIPNCGLEPSASSGSGGRGGSGGSGGSGSGGGGGNGGPSIGIAVLDMSSSVTGTPTFDSSLAGGGAGGAGGVAGLIAGIYSGYDSENGHVGTVAEQRNYF
ncbi:MAG: putative metal-binding motif-containing protein [Deltaproteobacteria bacterium]|nr:putative metal-binding motif-containing protein [Deltaproteobacteria bacterium]